MNVFHFGSQMLKVSNEGTTNTVKRSHLIPATKIKLLAKMTHFGFRFTVSYVAMAVTSLCAKTLTATGNYIIYIYFLFPFSFLLGRVLFMITHDVTRFEALVLKAIIYPAPLFFSVYCTGCIKDFLNGEALEQIKKTDSWQCFLCVEYQKETHGLLRPKHSWQDNILKLFQPNVVTQVKLPGFSLSQSGRKENFAVVDTLRFGETKSFCLLQPLIPSEKRPIRVLSLSDGFATGTNVHQILICVCKVVNVCHFAQAN